MSAIVKFDAVASLADKYGLDPAAFLVTVKAVSMPAGHSDAELVSCLLVAREHGLNPLTKEIYFMKSRGGQIQPIVSVDGWIRKCNEHPQFDGVEFETETADGKPFAMTCRMYRKDRSRPIVVTEYLSECAQGGGVWKTHPMRMLRNRTYCQAARMAFGFAGIMEPDEFKEWQRLEPEQPIALQSTTYRDGAPIVFRGEPRKRSSSSAFKDVGGQDQFNALMSKINAATGDDLIALFDANERDGMPWAMYPQGWAALLQDAYYTRLTTAPAATGEADEPLADQPGFVEMLRSSMSSAESRSDLREIITGNAGLTRRCSTENRAKIAGLYREAMG